MQDELETNKFDLIANGPSGRFKSARVHAAIARAKRNYSTGDVPLLNYLDSVSVAIKLY